VLRGCPVRRRRGGGVPGTLDLKEGGRDRGRSREEVARPTFQSGAAGEESDDDLAGSAKAVGKHEKKKGGDRQGSEEL